MSSETTVRRRHVLYIPGYDPVPPRRYRELYRTEGAAQAEISGYEIALVPRPARTAARFGWEVCAEIEGARTETRFETLIWSDLVRDSMDRGIAATYLQMLRTAWIYGASGALFRLMRLRKGPVIAALYPVAMLLGQLALALAAGGLLGAGLHAALPAGAGSALVAVAVGAGAALALLHWFKRRDGRFFAYYLMHDYAYTAQAGGAYPPALAARIEGFAGAVAEALQGDVDEVLVVGHSSGAHLAVSVVALMIRQGRLPPAGSALGLLTLGQVVPMVSFLPGAGRLRADLRALAAEDRIAWVDVSAPGDGCSFALCDPVSVTGVAPEGKRWPLVISAAFSRTLSPARWKALRRRFFRLHFQYLCAFDRPGDYDYFRITAGPQTLAARFAERAPSRSRIETPLSGHRDLAS